MATKRFQIDIKPCHEPLVRDLMQRLGNVSPVDAIGFLIETQMGTALARLDPGYSLVPLVAPSPHPVGYHLSQPPMVSDTPVQHQQSVPPPPPSRMHPKTERKAPAQSEAELALAQLLG
jgi:hypothetical protein